jgi:IclR family transcriptional regulator, KDG regulon repressor
MDDHKYSVKVLEKVIKILNLYSHVEGSFTLDQIARKAGLSKTTAFRILKTLEKHEVFKHNELEETYSLGLKLMELGGIVYSSLSIRKVASPYLDALGHSLKATILLGIIKDDHLLYIDKRESESIIRVSSYIGLKRPPYYGMLGVTLVAYMSDDQQKKLLQLYPLGKITDKTVVDVEELLRRFHQTVKVGYYIEREEVIEGVMGIGVPIRDFSGHVVAALGASMPQFQSNEKMTKRVIKELMTASAAISKELGHC